MHLVKDKNNQNRNESKSLLPNYFKIGQGNQWLRPVSPTCWLSATGGGGGQGVPPKTTFALPKRRLPPKIFYKTIKRTIETIAYRLKNNGPLSFPSPPLNFFLAESQHAIFAYHMERQTPLIALPPLRFPELNAES